MLRAARGKICSVVLEKGKHRGGGGWFAREGLSGKRGGRLAGDQWSPLHVLCGWAASPTPRGQLPVCGRIWNAPLRRGGFLPCGRTVSAPTCAVRMVVGGGVPDAPGTAARLRAHMECAPTVWRVSTLRANGVAPTCAVRMVVGGGVPDTPGAAAHLRAHMECAPTV